MADWVCQSDPTSEWATFAGYAMIGYVDPGYFAEESVSDWTCQTDPMTMWATFEIYATDYAVSGYFAGEE